MRTRPLGCTGLQVSVLGYGASPLGSVFRPIDEAEGERAVRTAIELGINFIDVSPYYGHTRAETVLGRALRGIPRERYLLATKVGRYGRDVFDFSAGRVARSVEESLRRLGVETIDLIQCHDIEFGSLDQVVEETLPALRRLREAGKVRFIGITGYPLRIFREVLGRTGVDTVLSYCRYCLNDSTLEELLPWLASRGAGVINASPLAMGLLTGRGAPGWHPAPPELRRACAGAAAWCRERGVEMERLALQFAADQPAIATTLVGTASPENVCRNVAWVEAPRDPELVSLVRRRLGPVQGLGWPSGRPENN